MKATDILGSRLDEQGLREALNRSLARVHTHTQNRSIGLISANLAANTAQENAQARHALSQAAKQAGFGYAHVKGMGKEEDRVVSEPSLLIIGHEGDDPALKSFLFRQGQKYGQSSVIYKSGDSEDATGIYTRDDEEQGKHVGDEENWGKWHANRTAAQFFTRLKGGRQFDFGADTDKLDEMQIAYLRPVSFSNRHESLM